MSVQERRKYDSDFKRNAVKLTEESNRTLSFYSLQRLSIYFSRHISEFKTQGQPLQPPFQKAGPK